MPYLYAWALALAGRDFGMTGHRQKVDKQETGRGYEVERFLSDGDIISFLEKYKQYYSSSTFAPEFSKAVVSERNMDLLKKDLKAGLRNFFGIREGDRIVSTVILSDISGPSLVRSQVASAQQPLDKKMKIGHLSFLTVDEDKRKRGLGELTIREAIRFARSENFMVLGAEVFSDNPHGKDSLGTILRTGFVLDEVQVYEDGVACFSPHLSLNEDLPLANGGAEKIILPFVDYHSIEEKIKEGWEGIMVVKDEKGESFIEFVKSKSKEK